VGTPVGITYKTAAITAACTVSAAFAANSLTVTAPVTVDVNAPFSVAVAYDGPVPTSVGLAWTCSPTGAGSLTSTQTASSPVNFSSVTLTSAAACKFTATASNYLDGKANVVAGATGTLGCLSTNRNGGTLDPSALKTYVKASEQGQWGLVRGSNKDSEGCVVVPYIFTVDPVSNPQIAKFIAPDSSVTPFQKISAKYTVVWGRFDVIDDGANIWASKRPRLHRAEPSCARSLVWRIKSKPRRWYCIAWVVSPRSARTPPMLVSA
jgi:hypothetical protein